MKKKLDKGMMMEELLRIYFLKAGYYAVRGVPFRYKEFDITDIDLWLYGRTSSVSREVVIVDIKNKKTPQAIERIFWVEGLRKSISANRAVVATTDKRKEVRDFGKELGTLVLDGIFLKKLDKFKDDLDSRLTDEDFIALISQYELEKIDGRWKEKIQTSKSLLAKELSFDTINYWLGDARFFANQAIVNQTQHQTALRCFYLICSFISIAVDYLLKELSFLDLDEKIILLTEGFTYGSRGKEGISKVLDVSTSFIEQYVSDGSSISNQLRSGLSGQFSSLPTDILGEFFGKSDIGKQLFIVARDLENLAMRKDFSTHSQASVEVRSMIGCFLDFWTIDRSRFKF